MLTILWALSAFNLFASAGALAKGARLATRDGRAAIPSRRLRAMASVLCWSFPAIALVATAMAWRAHALEGAHAIALMLAPLGVLLMMGAAFAAVDIAEDGALDLGRGRGRSNRSD